jgi:transcriptional regulator with XRE-family HTH domain
MTHSIVRSDRHVSAICISGSLPNLCRTPHTRHMTANAGEQDERSNAPNDSTHAPPGDRPADTFAARLVLTRHHAGRLSIEQAAKACGLNAGTWHHWENGKIPRNQLDVAQAISDGLGMDFHWLLLGGPLLPARGRPVRKSSRITGTYRGLPIRATEARVIGGARRTAAASSAQPIRARRVIDRSQPVAA